jgi:hypothetical protein
MSGNETKTCGNACRCKAESPASAIVARRTCRTCKWWEPTEGTVDTAKVGLCTEPDTRRLKMHPDGGCIAWRLNDLRYELVCRRKAVAAGTEGGAACRG